MSNGGPADFTSFVATHEERIRAACHELTGQGPLGDLLAMDLLATVALRWKLWRPGRRQEHATARLDRLLHREARAWRREAEPQKRPGRIRVLVDVPVVTTGFADRAWLRASAMRRRRAFLAVCVTALIACIGAIGPRPPEVLGLPDPGPEALPPGVKLLPPFAELTGLARRTTRLPSTIDVATGARPDLGARPVRRAAAVMRTGTDAPLLLADDGSVRVMGNVPATARLMSTSLSPDGERVVFLTDRGLSVVDVTTGSTHDVAATPGPSLTWRDARTVLLPLGADSVEIDVDTAKATAVPGVNGDNVLTALGPADRRLVELLPAALAVGPHIRRWKDGAFEDRPVFGPPWVANWTGAGWSTVGLLVRRCSSGDIPLPTGQARAALAAVSASGLYEATLVAADAILLDVVGFADTGTVLVSASSSTRTHVLAWSPAGRTVQLVASVNGKVALSVADLLPAGP